MNARERDRSRAFDIPTPSARPPGGQQVEALTREQQRLARRSPILGCAVTTLDPAPLREALADLVTEIAESARVIGMLLRPAG